MEAQHKNSVKKLRGIPYNLAQSFFSTLRYWDGGYMDDWLIYGMRTIGVKEAIIDLLDCKVEPKILTIEPLKKNIYGLRIMLEEHLVRADLTLDYIKEAKLKVIFDEIPRRNMEGDCQSYIVDIYGHKYEGEVFKVRALGEEFNPFRKLNKKLLLNIFFALILGVVSYPILLWFMGWFWVDLG